MSRMSRGDRRDAIVAAAVAVAVRKGLASTTVRDVASEMGTSSGLIHHYFESMDDVLAAAFKRVASQDLTASGRQMVAAETPLAALKVFFRTYAPADKDWSFQLWLDAWAEAARRPAVRAISRQLNLEWQGLLEGVIRAGVADGTFTCAEPAAAAWRILSLLDGLALQVIAHGTTIGRDDVIAWTTGAAERELGLPDGALAARCARRGRARGTSHRPGPPGA